jgi:UDP-3-O-[3-hydroxymyristoyl] glucosamine N-acyltransferase
MHFRVSILLHLNTQMKFSEIIQKLGSVVTEHSLKENNNRDPEITGIAQIEDATTNTLSYVEGAKFAAFVSKTNASALILPPDPTLQAQAQERGIAWVSGKETRLLWAKAIAVFYQPYRPSPEIHPTAVIHPTAKVGNDVYIGPHAVIQQGVEIQMQK